MTKERICLVCGRSYQYCGHCQGNKKIETWRNNYCSEDCRKIFNTCSNFEGRAISGEDAYKILIETNVNLENVSSSVKNSVDKIMKYKPEKKSETEKEVQNLTHKPRRRRMKKEVEE